MTTYSAATIKLANDIQENAALIEKINNGIHDIVKKNLMERLQKECQERITKRIGALLDISENTANHEVKMAHQYIEQCKIERLRSIAHKKEMAVA